MLRRLFDLGGKVALVTGGSRGLGRAMVLAFAEAGADVVIASRKLASCEATAREGRAATGELRPPPGRGALPVACHVGHWGQVEALAEVAYAEFGRVDVLVNNAGMSPIYDRVEDVSEDLWDKVLDVNLKGPFRLTASVIPYAAAKAAVNAMTEGFARAFGPTVRVNCIMPGPFLTDISKAWDLEAFRLRAKQTMPLGRGGEPDEIVGAARYFASGAPGATAPRPRADSPPARCSAATGARPDRSRLARGRRRRRVRSRAPRVGRSGRDRPGARRPC